MSTDVVKRLQERRLKLVAELRSIAETALDESRELTPEEHGRSEAINAEIDSVTKRISGFLEEAERTKAQDAKLAEIENRQVDRSVAGSDKTETGKELRAFLTGAPGAPRIYEVKPQGPVNFRDLTKLTGAAGGDVVPTSFYDRLMAHLIENSAMLQTNPTVLNTTSGENVEVPKTLTHTTGAIVVEADPITESDPTFDKITLGAFKYGRLVQISTELSTDSGVDLEGYLAMSFGRAIGNTFGNHLVVGTGTGQPRGITIDSTLGVTGGAGVGGAFTGDNLIDLFYSVISPYRMSSSCMWMMRDSSIAAARKLKDTQGQYLWQPGLQAGQPDLLLGKPIVSDPNVAAVALSAKSVVFGDFSQYFVRIAGGVRFERSDDFAFGNDLVSFRALLRGDGALVDLTGAVKHFAGNAA